MILNVLFASLSEWYGRNIAPPVNERLLWSLVSIGMRECGPGTKLVERGMVNVNVAWGLFRLKDGTLREFTIDPEAVSTYQRERK